MSNIETNPNSSRHGLKRSLSGSFALAVIVGGIIGLGILRTPGEIAAVVSDAPLYMMLWAGAGLFVLLSTVVICELLGMTPRSGGTYALVRRAYGPFPGFVIGWIDWLSFVGDIALKAVVIMEFFALLFPIAHHWYTPLAIMVTTVFAALQIRGLALGARIQQVAAAAMALIILGFSMMLLFADPVATIDASPLPVMETGVGAWSLVLASIIFTYDGWMYAAYFSGEIKGGSGVVARACIKGTSLVIVLYLLLIAALLWSVPISSLAGTNLALAHALELAVSPAASIAVVMVAILILLAHQNLLYMSTPRILHALAVDGLVAKRLQTVASGGNPLFAVLLSWALAVGLIMVGGFRFLLHLCVFFYVILYIVLIVGVIILRIRQPDSERPYKAWGHPCSTVVCLAGWTVITLFQAVAEWETALYALAMIAVAWPVYRVLTKAPGLT